MIYECPNCRTPQEAGQTVCPHCFAHFDGPVPSDAVVPKQQTMKAPVTKALAVEAEAAPHTEVGAGVPPPEPLSAAGIKSLRPQAAPPAEAQASLEAPTLTEVPPDPIPPAASSSQPYLTTPNLSPLLQSLPDADTEPLNPPFSKLSRALLVAFPVILVLVLGSVFYANSLNTGSDTVPVPPQAAHAAVPLPPAPTPTDSPTILVGTGNTNNAADDPHVKMLAGRWVAGSGDFYVFNSDGTGLRGNPVKSQPEQTFLWGLAQNRLMLYQDKNEQLRFNAGPDNNTIFLGLRTGHYVQYSRSKT